MQSCEYLSPVGRLVLRSEKGRLTELVRSDEAADGRMNNALNLSVKWLDTYFAGEIPAFMPPISMEGSPFRRLIWEMLADIPYGQFVTYGELAKKAAVILGKDKMSAQAVGGAVGDNPICIIIPCHRVLGSDGSLTGYGYGIEMKEYLLRLEKIIL